MVRSGGGIKWLILIYIYYTKIYVTLYNLKCIANFEFQKLLQNSMLWRSTCFYIVTIVHWNIVFIESCMYKSVLGKINKLQKKDPRIFFGNNQDIKAYKLFMSKDQRIYFFNNIRIVCILVPVYILDDNKMKTFLFSLLTT
jgi:hypothetical protein